MPSSHNCMVDFIDEGWMHYRTVDRLIYDVLYADFGVAWEADWRQAEGSVIQVAAVCDFVPVGTARLVGEEGQPTLQLRQVAVLPAFRARGIGRALVEELELYARTTGTEEMWLNARQEAYQFYLKLGYEFRGDTYVSELTKIPHRPMAKRL